MKYEIPGSNVINVDSMDKSFYLIGLLNEFMNQFQSAGDSFFEDISWKQCFLIICIQLFKEPPSINDVARAMGSSHQNVKQMLNKMEKIGFVELIPDQTDKRKQRIVLTPRAVEFNQINAEPSSRIMAKLFENIDSKDLEITIKTIALLDQQIKQMKIDMNH